jgi:hypothetical protein
MTGTAQKHTTMSTKMWVFAIITVLFHLVLILSWSSHFRITSPFPFRFEPVQDSEYLKGFGYSEPLTLIPRLFRTHTEDPQMKSRELVPKADEIDIQTTEERPKIPLVLLAPEEEKIIPFEERINVELMVQELPGARFSRSINDDIPMTKRIRDIPMRREITFVDICFAETQRLNPGYDFFQIYRSGLGLRQGIGIYDILLTGEAKSVGAELDTQIPFHPPNRYFPIMSFTAGYPLSFMSPWQAYLLWVILIECSLGITIFLTLKWYGWGRGFWGALLWIWFTPYYLDIYLGQTSFIVAVLLFVLLAGLDRSKPGFVGFAYTTGLLIKPVPLYLTFVLLGLKRWKTLAAGMGLLLLTSFGYFVSYPEELSGFLSWCVGMKPLPSINLPGILGYVLPFGIIQLFSVSILFATLYFTVRYKSQPVLTASLWVAAYFLTYTHLWEHHYAFMVSVLILLWIRTGSHSLLILFLLIALPSPYLLIDPSLSAMNKILIRLPKTIAGIGLYIWLLKTLRTGMFAKLNT